MKHSTKTASGIIALSAAIGLTLSGCASGGSDGGDGGDAGGSGESTEVTVGIVQLSIFAPVYVAQAKGYFEDEGLDVTLENVKSGSDAIPLAASGKLDVVAGGVSAGFFSAVENGLDVNVVASMGVSGAPDSEPASALIVNKELYDSGELDSLEELEGKNIGALGAGGGTSAYYISLALEEVGLTAQDVKLVNVGNPDMPNGIKTGGLDAAFVSSPFWSNAVEQGVAVKMWQTPPGTSGTGIIYGGAFSESDAAQPFYDALARAAKDLQGEDKYSDENLKIIGDATEQTPEQVAAVPLYDWFPDVHPLPEQMAGMESLWMDFGALDYDEPLDPASYVDTSFAENVSTE